MKYSGSRLIRVLFAGAGLRVLSIIVSAIIGFFLTPFIIHKLGDKLYGIWVLAGSFSTSYALLDLGLASTVSRFVAVAMGKNDKQALNRTVNTALVIYCIMGITAFALACLLTIFASKFVEVPTDADLLATLIVLVGAEFAISFPLRALTGTISGVLRHDIISAVELLFRLVSSVAIVFVLIAGYGLIELGIVSLCLGVVRGFVWYFATRKVVPDVLITPLMASRNDARVLFSFSSWAFIAQIADILRFRVDNFVIGAFVGVAAVTPYSIATTLSDYFKQIMVAAMGVLTPLFAQQHGEGDVTAMQRTLFFGIRVAVTVGSFIGFGLIAWGKPFIIRWMGYEYLSAYPVLVVIVIGLLSALWQSSVIGLLYGMANHHFFAFSNSAEGILNLLLSVILVQYWGTLGVALGTCIPMVVIKIVVQPLFLQKVFNVPLCQYMRHLWRAVFCSAIALIAPSFFSYYWASPSYTRLVIVGLFSVIFYFPVAIILNFHAYERVKIFNAVFKKNT